MQRVASCFFSKVSSASVALLSAMGACTSTSVEGETLDDALLKKSLSGKCPVSGSVGGQCPVGASLNVTAKARAVEAAVADAEAKGKESKERSDRHGTTQVRLADLPELLSPPEPSEDTLKDLADIKSWPNVLPLGDEDIVVVKGAWNRTLAWKDALMEALVYRWIMLEPDVYDLLAVKFDELAHDLHIMIDKSVRALDPRTEVHHRESYTAGFPACVKRDFGDTPSEIMFHYTIMGLRPKHWAALKDSFMFAMKTHNPYCYAEHDGADLDRGSDSAIARFFHIHIVAKANAVLQKHLDTLQSHALVLVQRQANKLSNMTEVGHMFYDVLLSKYPELQDYFAKVDMDHLAQHLHASLVLVGSAGIQLRDQLATLCKLSQVHRSAMIPTGAYAQVGEVLCQVLEDAFEMTPELMESWVYIYMCCATVISAPMAVEERILSEATDFFKQLAKEENWSDNQLDARLKQVEVEIEHTGTYRHTTAELEAGARLAWRNAPKCIGRIAWDTLKIRDRRHVTTASGVLDECKQHLLEAANNGVVQSLMTIFAPRKGSEKWGMRFWNSQFCRYAGYKQKDGSVLGDPANVEFTEMVMEKFKWKPPAKRTAFDPLPQVVQLPGQAPVMRQFDRALFCEIPLTHPKYSKFESLGLKWTSLPCITCFNFRLGGVNYPCCPFNGWFVDLEIARNLVERYDVGPKVGKICGFDMSSDSTGWRSMVYQVVAAAVTHSFQKKKFSIVDHYTVSCQFLTHVDREKRVGREVPAQWSWIGGFAGVHCPVWGYEMRDFYLRPQYHYQCDKWVVEEEAAHDGLKHEDHEHATESAEVTPDRRTVLVLYASTTGSSERYARAAAKAIGGGYKPIIMELDKLTQEAVERHSHILLCVATFNDGTAPLNGKKFTSPLPFKLVDKRTNKPVKYAMMCLGSSIYPKFCAFGKYVDEALAAAGGQRFMKTVLSDETSGHDANFKKFMSSVSIELEERPLAPGEAEPYLEISLSPGEVGSAAEPDEHRGHMRATVQSTENLFADTTDERSTKSIKIDISKCPDMTYLTGGHLSVLPLNPHDEIVALCDELGIPRDQLNWRISAVTVDGAERFPADVSFQSVSLFDALKWHFDISIRKPNLKDVLRVVKNAGGMTEEELEAHMEHPEETVAHFWWVSRVLKEYPKAKGNIKLADLFNAMGSQHPRLYSIASSNIASPSVVELCVGLVCVEHHKGLASGYLHCLEQGSPVYVSARTSDFVLPTAADAPIIMVSAGTGIAPFMGFVQERKQMLATSELSKFGVAQLYTGCRNKNEQLYADFLEAGVADGVISKYSASLSRETGIPKEYVTDALRNGAEQIWSALQNSACHYYFCGDGRMADSAYEALLASIVQGAAISRAKAVAAIDEMRSEGRYHLDVWGTINQCKTKRHLKQRTSHMAKQWLSKIADAEEEDEEQ
eukprot:TRINITY_DN8808_c0_g3_i1.p1 TRINITY_DN8808_c0_g3~~TRINITY_DN8808_c0_g3_i1.p1  ORF type:complete len:1428 (-),score=224.99 TRINITY_DN8808_c0_g3_i1:169-4452(-)